MFSPDRAVRWLLAAVLALFTGIALAPSASAATIDSAGPLTSIAISPDLNCDVRYEGDRYGEWYDDIACGTFVAYQGAIYGPASVPAGSGVTGVGSYEPFTAISQSGVSGTGTSSNPYAVTTTVGLGDSGATLTQTDTYVAGATAYRTDVRLTAGSEGGTAVVYRGGDCYLQDSDTGLGQVVDGNSPVCKAQPGSANPERVEGFRPLSAGAAYIVDRYSTVWSQIGTGQMLPNECRCTGSYDNAAAISWSRDVAAGATVTLSSLTFFSPVGTTPLTVTKTVDRDTAEAGSEVTYTINVANSGATPQTLTAISDSLPAGFVHVPGSTTGVTTSDPTGAAPLTWTGPFEVPAAAAGTPGSVSLSFRATVSDTPGTYRNSAGAEGEGVTVVSADDVAPVTVTAAPTPTTDPTDPTTDPTDPTTEPTDPTTEPTDPTTEPTDPTTDPTDPTATTDPTDPTTDPTDPTTDPTDPTATTEPTSTTSTTVPIVTPDAPQTPEVVQTDGGPMGSSGQGPVLMMVALAGGLFAAGALRWSVRRPVRRY